MEEDRGQEQVEEKQVEMENDEAKVYIHYYS